MKLNQEPVPLPLPDQTNFETSRHQTFSLAGEKLGNLENIIEICRKSESVFKISDNAQIIYVNYLNRTYKVTAPGVSVSLSGSDEGVNLVDQILILHYLNRALGTPLSGKLIAYKELREGAGYYSTFFLRAIQPLIRYFGPYPEKLPEAAVSLGGYRVPYGDISVTVPVFSRVPVTLVVWRGDDEFEPNANILFDQSILDYLSAEDINVICQTVAWKLISYLKK